MGPYNNNSAHRKAAGKHEDNKSNIRRLTTQIGTSDALMLILRFA